MGPKLHVFIFSGIMLISHLMILIMREEIAKNQRGHINVVVVVVYLK